MSALQILSLKLINNPNISIKALLFNPVHNLSEMSYFVRDSQRLLGKFTSDQINLTSLLGKSEFSPKNIKAKVHFTIYTSNKRERDYQGTMLYKNIATDKLIVDVIEVDTEEHNLAGLLKNQGKLNPILTNFLKS
jgi:hypothetical protein